MAKLNDFTKGNIKKQLLIFCLPVLAGNLFQQFYNIADTAIAGHLLGDSALSAIGASSSINSLVLTFAFGLNGGFGIVIAQSFGQKNKEKLRKAFSKSILFNAVVSVLVAIFTLIFLRPILRVMNTPESIFSQAYSYISVLLLYVFVTMFYNLEATVLRSLGDSKTPFYFVAVSTLLNIALDYIFIKYCNMGIKGAAVATVIAQAVSCVLCAIAIIKNYKELKPQKGDFKHDARLTKSMLSAGFTMAIMNSIFSIGSIIMQSAINSLGSGIIAAHLAARKISEIFMQPLVTIGSACSTFVGQNYGAGYADRIKDTMKYGSVYSLIWAVLSFFVLFFSGNIMVKLMTGSTDSIVIENAVMYLKINAPFYFMLGLLFNLRFSIQSIDSRFPPFISSGMELGSKILAAFLLIPVFGYIGACVAEPLSWTLGAIYLVFAFRIALRKISEKT